MNRKSFFTSRNIAFLAVLVALVVVLQTLSTLIGRLGGTPLSLVLIPVVLGAVMLGPLAGLLLGSRLGLGTVVGLLLTGPSIQLFNTLFARTPLAAGPAAERL